MLLYLFLYLSYCKYDGSEYNRDLEYTRNKVYYIQRHLEKLNSHKKFTETNALVMLEMKDCYPNEIKKLINKVISIYGPYDDKSLSESLALDKMFKDLQNYKPFCRALYDSMDIYAKKMTGRINMIYFEPEEAKSKKEEYKKLSLQSQCDSIIKNITGLINEEFGSIRSKGMLCLRTVEISALFFGLRDKTNPEKETLINE